MTCAETKINGACLSHVFLSDIYRSAYKMDPEFLRTGIPKVVMETMVHESLHDRDKLFLYETARGKWEAVDDEIGWKVYGNWADGLDKLMTYIWMVMLKTPVQGQRGAWNAWDLCLIKAGLKGPQVPGEGDSPSRTEHQ